MADERGTASFLSSQFCSVYLVLSPFLAVERGTAYFLSSHFVFVFVTMHALHGIIPFFAVERGTAYFISSLSSSVNVCMVLFDYV